MEVFEQSPTSNPQLQHQAKPKRDFADLLNNHTRQTTTYEILKKREIELKPETFSSLGQNNKSINSPTIASVSSIGNEGAVNDLDAFLTWANNGVKDLNQAADGSLFPGAENCWEEPSALEDLSEQIDSSVTALTAFYGMLTNQNMNGDVKDVAARLLPLSAMGNGILSQFELADLSNRDLPVNQGKNSGLTVQPSGDNVLNKQQPLKQLNGTLLHKTAQTLISAALSQSSAKTVSTRQNHGLSEVLSPSPQLAEILKRHALLLSEQDSNSLWLRDFQAENQEVESLVSRLKDSDFVRQNNIDRIYFNGSLVWNKETEK